MEPTNTAEGVRRLPAGIRRLSFGAVLLGVGWSAAALGASGFGIDCDRSATDLLSSEVPADELTISVVDLANDDSAIGISAPLDDVADTDASAAPLLYLAPRVATIVEDVFGNSAANDESVRDAHPGAASRGSSMAPLADSADEPSQSAVPEPRINAPPPLPRIQREMYRTDI